MDIDHLTDKELKEYARKGKAEYMREWNKDNKDKVKRHQRRYWAKKYLEAKES